MWIVEMSLAPKIGVPSINLIDPQTPKLQQGLSFLTFPKSAKHRPSCHLRVEAMDKQFYKVNIRKILGTVMLW